jgi:Fe-S-cluster containining protein
MFPDFGRWTLATTRLSRYPARRGAGVCFPSSQLVDMKVTAVSDQPWFHQGLRFECTQCGDCCTGAPGYVWVNAEEIAALAAEVGLPLDEFQHKYVRRVGIRRSLVEFPNGDCVFFDNQSRRCTVYNARPRQCRTWPFWQSNVRTPEAWADTCSVCPGCGHGPLAPAEQILHQLSVVRV